MRTMLLAIALSLLPVATAESSNRWVLSGSVHGGSGCYSETHTEGDWTRKSEICELLVNNPTSEQGPALVYCRRDTCAEGRCPAAALPHRGKRGGPIERCEIVSQGGDVRLIGWVSGRDLYVLHVSAQ